VSRVYNQISPGQLGPILILDGLQHLNHFIQANIGRPVFLRGKSDSRTIAPPEVVGDSEAVRALGYKRSEHCAVVWQSCVHVSRQSRGLLDELFDDIIPHIVKVSKLAGSRWWWQRVLPRLRSWTKVAYATLIWSHVARGEFVPRVFKSQI